MSLEKAEWGSGAEGEGFKLRIDFPWGFLLDGTTGFAAGTFLLDITSLWEARPGNASHDLVRVAFT